MTKGIPVEFIDNFLIVWNTKDGSELYKMGYYGKPLGIPKPKIFVFDKPLILDLMEGVYLAEKKIIDVRENQKKRKISVKTLKQKAQELYDSFDEKYAVYHDLRRQGFIVTPGIKYGCDFAVYREGPGLEHAPYMVSVKKDNENISATEIVKVGRLATTVRKRFIIAIPKMKKEKIEYLIFKWFKA